MEFSGTAWDGTHIWVTLPTSNAIAKLQTDGTIVATYTVNVPASPTHIAVDFTGLVWVGNSSNGGGALPINLVLFDLTGTMQTSFAYGFTNAGITDIVSDPFTQHLGCMVHRRNDTRAGSISVPGCRPRGQVRRNVRRHPDSGQYRRRNTLSSRAKESNTMSIRNNTRKRKEEEKKARPDAMHRAIRFLLEQAKMNNRDITTEADEHMQTLDELLGDKKELSRIKTPAPANAVEMQAPPAAVAETAQPEVQDTAALLRQSGRFRR